MTGIMNETKRAADKASKQTIFGGKKRYNDNWDVNKISNKY